MEQDPPLAVGKDELPTYDDLATQNGPNSRFGRWKEWVEKRAAERYAEDTPERRQARRMRGWGPHVDTQDQERPRSPFPIPLEPQPNLPSSSLDSIQAGLSNSSLTDSDPTLASAASSRGQDLPPSHLKLHSFGSRFLPHSTRPILTLLPLFDDTKLLIGHMDGLSVLDMHPDVSLSGLGSNEPRRQDIWYGVGVYQLALLESEQRSARGTPQGVILALVGAEPPEGGSEKDSKEPHREIRMYNLASLASITSWATAGKDQEPLNLSRPNNREPQQPSQKKHKPRGLKSPKSASIDATPRGFPLVHPYDLERPPTPPPKDLPKSPLSPNPTPPTLPTKVHRHSGSTGSDWDVGRDELPLRWATDYVRLASSRFATQSVLFFELHRCTGEGRITACLAVATKQNILFYESVRGERAFRFVKEFYTPLPARSARFVYQSSHDILTKAHLAGSASLAPPHFATYSSGSRGQSGSSSRRASSPGELGTWGGSPLQDRQLSLFVVFEKKAGLIRVSDSTVGEIELWEDSGEAPKSSFRRSFTSMESLASKDYKDPWAPPAEIEVPLTPIMPQNVSSATIRLYFLTRGKRTHILPSPLPMPLGLQAPLKILKWGVQPTQVVPRACERPASTEPFLQVTALSEDGVEIQEFPLTFLSSSKGKGRERSDTVVAQAEVGAWGAGFLCMGGHWTEQEERRNESSSTTDTVDIYKKRTRQQGFYAWTREGYSDWRVFWLGGDSYDEHSPATP